MIDEVRIVEVGPRDGLQSISEPISTVEKKTYIDMLSEDFVYQLRDNFSVLLTAGKWHGLEGFVRIGYGTPADYVQGGLDKIADFLNSL